MYDQLQVCAGIEGILAAGCTEETLKPALTTMMQLALGLDKFPVTRGEAERQWEDAAQSPCECSELDNNVKGAMANCISLAYFPTRLLVRSSRIRGRNVALKRQSGPNLRRDWGRFTFGV